MARYQTVIESLLSTILFRVILVVKRNYDKCCQPQQTLPHAPLQGAAIWRI